MKANKLVLTVAVLVLLSGGAYAQGLPEEWLPQPEFIHKPFLFTVDIEEFTLDWALAWTDSMACLALHPFDAVVLHVQVNGIPKDVFVFSDDAFNRLTIWQCSAIDPNGNRTLEIISDYHCPEAGGLHAPSGMDTNAKGRLFNPDQDVVFLADKLNSRVLELSYRPDSSGGTFALVSVIGEGYVERPIDVAISAYGDGNYYNADLYVVDKGMTRNDGKLHRFSVQDGSYEGTWQSMYMPGTEYEVDRFIAPISVACYPACFSDSMPCYPDSIPNHSAIYVVDEAENTMYYLVANTDDPPSWVITYDQELGPEFSRPGGVAVDDYGRIYVANQGTGKIEIYGPYIGYLYEFFGQPGSGPNLFKYPHNIILDTYYGFCEAVVFEFCFRDSGLETFIIDNGAGLSRPQIGFVGGHLIHQLAKTSDQIPSAYALFNSYPNPFNSQCKISFSLPEQCHVTIEVFNILGQKVAVLLNEDREPGEYSVTFNASSLNSGVYHYRLKAGEYSAAKSTVLIK